MAAAASGHTITPDPCTRVAPRLLAGLADYPHGRVPAAAASRRPNGEFGAGLPATARGRIAMPDSAGMSPDLVLVSGPSGNAGLVRA